MSAELKRVALPDFGRAPYPGLPLLDEFTRRLSLAQAARRDRGWSHLIVYADREHFANLAWLTGFDPRFEEALLILGEDAAPLLLTGIECAAYLPISPLWKAGLLRHERWDGFSLMSIPRRIERPWNEIFSSEGIGASSHVGVAGWKAYSDPHALDVPAYLADSLRSLGSTLTNAAPVFVDPEAGLRSTVSPADIALFEWGNIEASDGMKTLIQGLRLGATDHDMARLIPFNGSPQPCHWSVKTGPQRISLASPRGHILERGHTFSANISYWGANCCRAAWLAAGPQDAPDGYAESFAGPYFAALGEWFAHLQIGRPAGDLQAVIHKHLSTEMFGIQLNPGHLIHLDEWPSSPVYEGSNIPLRSGMLMQCDVIPSHPRFFSTRMEDSYLLADAALQAALDPALLARCLARQSFMRLSLGLPVPDEVLPLSNLAGVIQPYLLDPGLMFTLRGPG